MTPSLQIARNPSRAPLVDNIRAEVDAWRSQDYPSVSATSRRLLEHWFLDEHQTSDGTPFAYYPAQREALETLIYLWEVARSRSLSDLAARYATKGTVAVAPQFPYSRYVFKMATGSGKTKVMSLAIAWSYFHSIFEPSSPLPSTFLLVAPNLIVFERLKDDFEAARIFRDDPVIPPEWRRDFDLKICLRNDPVPASAPGVLGLTNIQALYERRHPTAQDPVSTLLGPQPSTRLATVEPLLPQLARRGRILAVNDEAHHIHDQITSDTGEPLRAVQTLNRLHELALRHGEGVVAQLDFSATPKNQQGQLFPDIIVDYPLAQAIEDGIVKRPIIGELHGAREVISNDAGERYQQQIAAGLGKWREFEKAWMPAGRKPLIFFMAEDTKAADQIAARLQREPDLSGRVLTIHVNMAGKNKGEIAASDLELARRAAREIDSDDNPYAAIVSVLMLREGWDVRNVTVIVPLRALTAKAQILPEQTLGRGLRRMTPVNSGVKEQVVVIDHEAFRHLWDDACIAEGLTIDRRDLASVPKPAQVITVDQDRLEYDVRIPRLSRILYRDTSELDRLIAEDAPARHLELPRLGANGTVEYVGRDLLTGEEVERARYPLLHANDPGAVLAWYVNALQHETRVTGKFAVLAPLVKRYIETRAFGGTYSLDDRRVLKALSEPHVQATILGALQKLVDTATLTSTPATDTGQPIKLAATRPFLWSGETAVARKSVFAVQPCDSGLEVQMVHFLDRCPDIGAFAKLAPEVRFSLEYRTENGRLAYYYPDFVLRTGTGDHWIIETKGRSDLDVPRKDDRATRWAVDATLASSTRWRYARVDQELFDRHALRLASFDELIKLIYTGRREEYLFNAAPTRKRSREEILAAMEEISARMEHVTGLDDEINRLRDNPRG